MNKLLKAKSDGMLDIINGEVTAMLIPINNAYLHDGDVCRRTLRGYESVVVDKTTLAAVSSGFMSIGDNVKVMEPYKSTKTGDEYYSRDKVSKGTAGIVSPIGCPFSKGLTVVTIKDLKVVTYSELTNSEVRALGIKKNTMENIVSYLSNAPGKKKTLKECANEVENDITSDQLMLYVSFEVLIEDYRKEKPRFAQTLIS